MPRHAHDAPKRLLMSDRPPSGMQRTYHPVAERRRQSALARALLPDYCSSARHSSSVRHHQEEGTVEDRRCTHNDRRQDRPTGCQPCAKRQR